MFRILVMSGLLINLILTWTSAGKAHSKEPLIKTSPEYQTGPLSISVSKHLEPKNIRSEDTLCSQELGGVCVKKNKECQSPMCFQKPTGKPYCPKKQRCCYPGPVWSVDINACIWNHNEKIIEDITLTLDDCKKKCEQEKEFECKSIDYTPNLRCVLSKADSSSEDYQKPCSSPWQETIFAEILNCISCNLEWKYEGHRPLIMIRETKSIIPPVEDTAISENPNRIPTEKKLIFACPGENNQFEHVLGTHTKLHGECTSDEKFKVCVNDYPEYLDLSQLSCSKQMFPSIIKQQNDDTYRKSCDVIEGELYKMGFIYGDKKEFKDLDTKICFSEKNLKTLWTSTNVNSNEISPSRRYMDPSIKRSTQGIEIGTLKLQKTQQNIFEEVQINETTSVLNDMACNNHGGYCVKEGEACPNHLPYQTSQGEFLCSNFYRCCYSETLRKIKSLQKLKENSRLLRAKSCERPWKTKDIPTFENSPLILDSNTGNMILPEGINPNTWIRVKSGTELVFVCPEKPNNWLKKYEGTATKKGICNNGVLLIDGDEITWTEMGCKGPVKPSAMESKIPSCTPGNSVPKKCGPLNNGREWIIGFKTYQLPHFFSTLIEVCFEMDKGKETTLFTKSWIHGKNVLAKDDKYKPDFATATPPFTINMDTVYKETNEKKLFNKVLGDVLGIEINFDKQKLFSKGHLTPRSDFITKGGQAASYYYLNALPQWQTYNGGNWAHVEQKIEGLAAKNTVMLEIYTGGSGEMKIPDADGLEVYLGQSLDPKSGKVPIPNLFWKVVTFSEDKKIVKAVAFVTNNNPLTEKPAQFKVPCPDVCEELSNWITPDEVTKLHTATNGYTYCCNVKDLNKDDFPNIPVIDNDVPLLKIIKY